MTNHSVSECFRIRDRHDDAGLNPLEFHPEWLRGITPAIRNPDRKSPSNWPIIPPANTKKRSPPRSDMDSWHTPAPGQRGPTPRPQQEGTAPASNRYRGSLRGGRGRGVPSRNETYDTRQPPTVGALTGADPEL